MKRRDTAEATAQAKRELCAVLAALGTAEEIDAFLTDLCTDAELEALCDRWRVAPLAAEGVPYREISERTGVSVTTVGRVAKCVERGAGGYRAALRHRP